MSDWYDYECASGGGFRVLIVGRPPEKVVACSWHFDCKARLVPRMAEEEAARMTDGELAEISARAAAATKGPWENRKDKEFPAPFVRAPLGLKVAIFPMAWLDTPKGKKALEANAEFIANARQDVPRIVDAGRKEED